jgi:hypothetical protein
MSQHAIRMVQRNLTPGGDKNGADINLALDALEMAFTHDHINAFVIVGGDSDFITLVEKLKQYDKKVFVVGGRQFTSQVMQKNCHEFIAYENLVSRRPAAPGPGPRRETSVAATAADVAGDSLVKRALKVLTDREVSPQLGLLKSTLLQLDSTFSERDYGVSTFRDFIEKVAKTGLVTLRHSGRSMMVDAVETADGMESSDIAAATTIVPIQDQAPSAVPQPPQPVSAPSVVDPEQIQQVVESTRNCSTARCSRRDGRYAFGSSNSHPWSGFGIRRAQVGLRDRDGVSPRVPARRAVPSRARSSWTDPRVPWHRAADRVDVIWDARSEYRRAAAGRDL